MTESQLKKLINEFIKLPAETEWVEFKKNNARPEEIGETISALSNSASLHEKDKAYLIYGIEDNSHKIVGTNIDFHNLKNGNQPLLMWLNQMLNPRIDFRIHQFNIGLNNLVLFEIPAANNYTVKFKNIAYIRIGNVNQKLNDYPEKEKQIWIRGQNRIFEKDIALGDLLDNEVLSLLDYPTFFDYLKEPLPTTKSGILEKLLNEKLITKDGAYYCILNLGAILLAKDLNRFEGLSRKSVRVVVYAGKDKLKTKKEQIGGRGYASGFSGLISFIQSQLPQNEVVSKALRKEIEMYPVLAIRELVANALIHQDLSISGTSPMIEIYSDRVEISNPGRPLIPTLRFIDHSPISRNEKLAKLMRRLNICEERGSGIDKVIFQTEFYQLPAPEFTESNGSTKVTLYAYKLLREMNRDDKIRACYQHCCLKYVSNENMTNQTLRERFKVEEKNYSIVSRIISESIKKDFIRLAEPDNKSKKYAKYVPFWA